MTPHRPEKILVTGAAGFIGSNLVRSLREAFPDALIVSYDALTYAGNMENLSTPMADERHRFVKGDIRDGKLVSDTLSAHSIDTVFNLAAESHVDRSILSGGEFVRTNVEGTLVMLESALAAGVARFVHVSTDEVYGSLGNTGKFTETTPLAPNSPYSASKAGSDLLARAWFHTFGFPVVVTRCSNNYGPFQFPEKLIPLMIAKARAGERLPVYGDGRNVRDWIHVDDHCAALILAATDGVPGETYNVGADNEWMNIDIVRELLRLTGRGDDLISYVKDRPGHDRRYAIDSSKAKNELGWTPKVDFAAGLAATVEWYLANEGWWKRIMTGEYLDFYQRNYAPKLAE